MTFIKPITKIKTIYYVVDNKGWVQHRRFQYLKKYIDSYRLRLLTVGKFKFLWRLGLLRRRHIFFSTWRIAHALLKRDPNMFTESDFKYFMAAVTSHSNIGGGLDPLNPIPGRRPKEAFDLAVRLLRKFKVISVNSMILHELLHNDVSNLMYCPNGVDIEFFTPDDTKDYNPSCIRIGWVGKVRGPKNFPIVEEALKKLRESGRFMPELVKVPKDFSKIPLSFQKMRDFYKRIDFYLCASWNEGTPNPALEAGACGIPVITTRVGNMRELIKGKENGFFIEPTVESIVSQFNEIAGLSKERYSAISKAMRDSIASEWSWGKRVKNFITCFDRLVS